MYTCARVAFQHSLKMQFYSTNCFCQFFLQIFTLADSFTKIKNKSCNIENIAKTSFRIDEVQFNWINNHHFYDSQKYLHFLFILLLVSYYTLIIDICIVSYTPPRSKGHEMYELHFYNEKNQILPLAINRHRFSIGECKYYATSSPLTQWISIWRGILTLHITALWIKFRFWSFIYWMCQYFLEFDWCFSYFKFIETISKGTKDMKMNRFTIKSNVFHNYIWEFFGENLIESMTNCSNYSSRTAQIWQFIV